MGNWTFAARLRARERLVGYWSQLPVPAVQERAARHGYDYVCFDAQHGFLDYHAVLNGLIGIDAGAALAGSACGGMVRVAANDPALIGQALDAGAGPLKDFMMKQTRQSDLALYVKLSNSAQLQGPEDVPLRILVPAFITSELKTAFQISFAIFIPFLIIDLVVASVLMAVGMMMVPPASVALPFKLIFFVLVDGWGLVAGSLVKSYGS